MTELVVDTEKRPICTQCRRQVFPYQWALRPLKLPRTPMVLVAVCWPKCPEPRRNSA